jgi:hypothetical protein
MNIFRSAAFRALGAALLLPAAAALLAACDVGSVDSASATLSDNTGAIYNFAGLYMHPENATSSNGVLPLVYPFEGSSRPSGQLITSLRLLQYGSVLEAYDSANQVWLGKISSLQGSTANFTLSGRTTAGQSVEIAGTMAYSDQQSTMNATWIEPAYYGSLFAKATVAPVVTNSPTPTNNPSTVRLSAGSSTVSSNGVVTLTASGGSSYTWTLNTSLGTLAHFDNHSTNAFRRTGGVAGNTVTVTVGSDGRTASQTITFN